MCCVCAGVYEPKASPYTCVDTDNGAYSVYTEGGPGGVKIDCRYLYMGPGWCGMNDDENFDSSKMCCICGGGTKGQCSDYDGK